MNRRGFFAGAAAAVFAAIVSVHIDLVAEPELDRDPDKGPTWNEVLERQITKVRAARAQAAKKASRAGVAL